LLIKIGIKTTIDPH